MKRLFSQVLALLLVILWGHGISHASLSDGLVAYYPFNGNANDESGSGNHGTVHGATLTEDRFGNPNSAYYFDGIDNFIDATPVNLQTGESFTMSQWIEYELQPNRIWAMYFNTDGGSTGFHVLLNTDQWGFHNTQCGLFNGTQNHFDVSAYQGQWFHMVTEYDASRCLLISYLNGVMVDSQSVCYFPFSPTEMYIGQPHPWWSGDSYYKGALDDIRIYNRALSDAEIQELYNFTPQPRFPLDDSVSYSIHWRMCDPNYPGDGEHEGVDIMVQDGTNVYPVCDGTVVFNWTNSTKYRNEYDKYFNAFLVIKHDCNGQSLYGYYGHITSDLKANAGEASEVKVADHLPIGQIRKAYKIDKKSKAILRDPINDHLHLGININTQKSYVTNHWGIAPPGVSCPSLINNGWRDAIDYFGW